MYITDMDGTLLDAQGRLSAYSRRALDKLYACGVMITVATARSWSALNVLDGVRFHAPLVLLGGARLYDSQTKTILREHTLSVQDAFFTLDTLKAQGLSPLLYTQNAMDEQCIYYSGDASPSVISYVQRQRALGDTRFCCVSRHEDRFDEKLFYLTARGDEAQMAPVVEQLRTHGIYSHLFHGNREEGCFIEACAVPKLVGVRDLREATGAGHIVAFGDNGNDVGLFEGADECIAVENATPQIKRMAHRIIGSNTSDAVVREALQREGIQWDF